MNPSLAILSNSLVHTPAGRIKMKILRLRRSRGSGWNIHIEKSLVLLVHKVNYWYQGQLFGSGTWTSIFGSICPSLTLLSIETKFKYQPEEKEINIVKERGLHGLMISR